MDVIVDRVHTHGAGAPQSDDITLVAVRLSFAR
jgi:serine phosphatase RsbU (regulator of sigma subunit)